jgi:hypothetical protein
MALLQCICIVILQTIICSQNTLQADLLPDSTSNILAATTTDPNMIPLSAADRLSRIKWENIAFIGFQIWFFGMTVDAVSNV